MDQTTLTLRFKGAEARVLDRLVNNGVFNSKSEAIRSALVHYSLELGLFEREKLWNDIQKIKPRKISQKQFAKELQDLENED